MKVAYNRFAYQNNELVMGLARQELEAVTHDVDENEIRNFDVRVQVIAWARTIDIADFRKRAGKLARSLEGGRKTKIMKIESEEFFIAQISGWAPGTTVDNAGEAVLANVEKFFGDQVAVHYLVTYWP